MAASPKLSSPLPGGPRRTASIHLCRGTPSLASGEKASRRRWWSGAVAPTRAGYAAPLTVRMDARSTVDVSWVSADSREVRIVADVSGVCRQLGKEGVLMATYYAHTHCAELDAGGRDWAGLVPHAGVDGRGADHKREVHARGGVGWCWRCAVLLCCYARCWAARLELVEEERRGDAILEVRWCCFERLDKVRMRVWLTVTSSGSYSASWRGESECEACEGEDDGEIARATRGVRLSDRRANANLGAPRSSLLAPRSSHQLVVMAAWQADLGV